MSAQDDHQITGQAVSMAGGVTDTGVLQVVLDGYNSIYDALPRGETFSRLWRTNAYGGDFPEEFAHIGFLTLAEAQRTRELLQLGAGGIVADLACGAGGPGLWMAKQSGASLIGADPSAAGLSAARTRAHAVGLADRARFQEGTFERTNLPDGAVDAAMSVDAFQYAPDKRAALAEFFRILRPGGRVSIIAFEVDPAKVAGVAVIGADPIPDYAPLLAAAGFDIEAYEETLGWRERVNAAFGAIIDASDTLTAEMGTRAASGVIAEALLTVQLQPYPRRVLAVARRPR
ncbi:MAG: methyltransferase domain-containing protein [Actinomycetota bacterium]|nr:methyltransferase domain-containing protein [Actinomycetota bacterium]